MRNKIILLLFLAALSYSCTSVRDLVRDKGETVTNELKETSFERIGDTVRYEIPKLVYKDTTITRKNYVTGTTQVIKFDKEGDVSYTECISGLISIIERYEKNIREEKNLKELESKKGISPSIVLYFMIGLLIVIIGLLFYKRVVARF
jgi:hypothetical protein